MKLFYVQRVQAYNSKQPINDPSLVFLNCPSSILNEFKKTLDGTAILGAQFQNPYTGSLETFPETVQALTSKHLQILARNEAVNVDGTMNTSLYNGLLTDDQIARIRCLVKSTTVSGSVYATHAGGFRSDRYKLAKPLRNILIDQAGLQWQNDYRNTGGLHFYPDNPLHADLPEHYQSWQEDMYKALYGFERPLMCSSDKLPVVWGAVRGFVDLNSVSNAIAIEFSQAFDAAAHQGNIDLQEGERINFRFSKAGMGFFCSGLVTEHIHALRVARLIGIERALQSMADLPVYEQSLIFKKIGRIVLPNSKEEPYSDEVLARIEHLVRSLGLEWGGTSPEDPFEPALGYVNATTNCGDPHAMPGNEGGPCSVDACISYNANINHHIATYNQLMQLRVAPEFVFKSGVETMPLTEVKETSGIGSSVRGFFHTNPVAKSVASSEDKKSDPHMDHH